MKSLDIAALPGIRRFPARRPPPVLPGFLAIAGWLLAIGAGALAPAVRADLPHPSFHYYGEILNAYGRPITQADQAQLILRIDGRECGRASVSEGIGPAINYRIEVPLDNGRNSHYADYAARTGDLPQFILRIGSVEYSLIDLENVPPVGTPGKFSRLDMVQDKDADNDDLPDTWELIILAAAPGRFFDIRQIKPEDDFDGDGMSNMEEFIGGTDPTWAIDFLAIEKWFVEPGSTNFWVGFYSVPGKTYELLATPSLGTNAAWQPMPFRLNSSGTPVATYLRGDGYLTWLGVPLAAPAAGTNVFSGFRLKVR